MPPTARPRDPVFQLPAPMLFAHRGGAKEVEESTRRGFVYAVGIGADVLEVDVHVLANGANGREFVVWHGPKLDNVLVDSLPGDKAWRPGARSKAENDIREWDWQQLKEHAWVVHPDRCTADPSQRDLRGAPQTADRMLLTLEDLLRLFPDKPINIELKDSVRLADLDRFVAILDAHAGGRTILVVSVDPARIDAFRQRCGDRYPTGFSIFEVGWAVAQNLQPFNLVPRLHHRRALQTTYHHGFTPAGLIHDVHQRAGAVHVFLTSFGPPAPAIDADPDRPTINELFEILDRGVDGVMTDRPGAVRGLMDAWLAQRGWG